MELFTASVMVEENERLCTLASMDELQVIIASLNSNRTPGANGFNAAFYRSAWPIIATDLLAAVNNFLRSAKLLAQANHTILCMIPKKTIPATLEDYRPIASCNVLYCINSKVLANRLKPLLPKLINFQSERIHQWKENHRLHSSHPRALPQPPYQSRTSPDVFKTRSQ